METINPIPELLQVLGQITPLPEPFQQRVGEQLITQNIDARTIIQHPGDTARRIYFIQSGLLRAYHLDPQGKEHTSWLMGPGNLAISVHSFLTQQPAHEYIQALTGSTVQSLSWNQLQGYYADFPQGNLIGRIFTERYYIQSEERAILLRTSSPRERFDLLLGQYPDIEQLTTTANIASYLGMTRETFSRMRAQLLREK